ncbi:sulfate adenylyltransferase subunit 1 [Piscinibacterium candidicorallinum]|uniref:sulfate adenylyltransferase n=1 Tax=Piscinibacterium candidicorallinum TaxID=1793872 RepID=A0ABV7H6A3_9BURK
MNAIAEPINTLEDRGVLRFITCGSVDDGKSTLIGRLLYDARAVLSDQLLAVTNSRHKRTEGEEIDLSLLTDGLEAEREQGITIDVAYRYFASPVRKFIIADCPGHVQYTRNMVTGASTADAAVLLIDATRVKDGALLEQTRRHAALVNLLGVRHLIAVVNKIDLLDYSEAVFNQIKAAFEALAEQLGAVPAAVIPVSALRGDNVVVPSRNTPWYEGPVLLEVLETLPAGEAAQDARLRFPVQWVNRVGGSRVDDFRGLAGTVAAGRVRVGDAVRIEPAGVSAVVDRIITFDGELQEAQAGMAVTLVLDRDVDASRGDMLVAAADPASGAKNLSAELCWLDSTPLNPARRYLIKHGTRTMQAKILALESRLDLQGLVHQPADGLGLNDIGRVRLAVQQPLVADAYAAHRATGRFVLIDAATNQTAAAGLIEA